MNNYYASQIGIKLWHVFFGRHNLYHDDPRIQLPQPSETPNLVTKTKYRWAYGLSIFLALALMIAGGVVLPIILSNFHDATLASTYSMALKSTPYWIYGSDARFFIIVPSFIFFTYLGFFLASWIATFFPDYKKFVTYSALVQSSVQRARSAGKTDLDELKEYEQEVRHHCEHSIDLTKAHTIQSRQWRNISIISILATVLLAIPCLATFDDYSVIDSAGIRSYNGSQIKEELTWNGMSEVTVTSRIGSASKSGDRDLSVNMYVSKYIESNMTPERHIELKWRNTQNGTVLGMWIIDQAIKNKVNILATPLTDEELGILRGDSESSRQAITDLYDLLAKRKLLTPIPNSSATDSSEEETVDVNNIFVKDARKEAQAGIPTLLNYCQSDDLNQKYIALVMYQNEDGHVYEGGITACTQEKIFLITHKRGTPTDQEPDTVDQITDYSQIIDWVVLSDIDETLAGDYLMSQKDKFTQ